MSATVMIVVTHLLGTGHLARALVLARAFTQVGHDAHVVSGGFAVPQLDTSGVTLHQLPPLRSDGIDFTTLLGADGLPVPPQVYMDRQAQLLTLLADLRPDVLITELFPFGRRNLKAEFLAVLQAVAPQTRVFCSVRDVLAPPSKPAKAEFAEATIAQHYDGVLVHSDPNILPLDTSWPITESLRPKLRYTGFVAPPKPARMSRPEDAEIVVSAGGGNVGAALFNVAAKAAQGHPQPWRILVGANVPDTEIHDLRARAGRNVTIERARPDFRELLARARASVSMCGYNTMMDVLQTGVPAVVVPFDAGHETEQTVRATALERLPGFEVLKGDALTADTLRDALERAMSAPVREINDIRFDGAQRTVQICLETPR